MGIYIRFLQRFENYSWKLNLLPLAHRDILIIINYKYDKNDLVYFKKQLLMITIEAPMNLNISMTRYSKSITNIK